MADPAVTAANTTPRHLPPPFPAGGDTPTDAAATAVTASPVPAPSAPLAKWTQLLIATSAILLLLLFVAVTIRLGMAIHHTLLLFALGGLIAYALDPVVEALRRPVIVRQGRPPRAVSRKVSVTFVFISLLVLLGLGLWWLGGRLASEVTILQRDFPTYRERAFAMADDLDQRLAARGINAHLGERLRNPPPEVTQVATRLGQEALPIFRHVFTDLGESAIVLLIALYFLLFGAEMREKFNALLPPRLLRYVAPWQTDVNRILGGFVRGQGTIALITGAAAAVVCFAIGIHLWALIGLFVCVAALIPVFGPYIGAVPAVLAALIGPTHFGNPVVAAVVVVALLIVINEIGSKVLYPKLVGAALGLHEVLVLFVIFAGLEINGIVGTLFAAPVTALVIVTVVHLYRFWQDLPDDLLSTVARREGRIAEKQPLP
jgi:predicted PurR-regulated permease PerM